MRNSKILGAGMFLPERFVPNSELEAMSELETTDEWIKQRSGIEGRYYAGPDDTGASMGEAAARQAIESAGLTPDDIDFILFATLSPDYFFPGNACLLQERLFGDRTVGSMDVRTQCTGFLYALTTADAMIKAGLYEHIIVVGAEVHTSFLEYSKEGRNVTVLFGDGAGAVVVGPAPEGHEGIIASALHAEGKYAKALWIESPSAVKRPGITEQDLKDGLQYPRMNGRLVFKNAIPRMVEVTHEVLNKAGLTIDDVDVVIPHQANLRINQAVVDNLGFPLEKVVNTIAWTGNTSSASIPIVINEALKQGKLKEGKLMLLVAFGAGFTWGATLVRW